MEQLRVGDESYGFHRLDARAARLPYTLRILLENVLRNGLRGGGRSGRRLGRRRRAVAGDLVLPRRACCCRTSPASRASSTSRRCATRCATQGGDPKAINPLIPVELVIDHSVQVDEFASRLAIERNVELEFERNRERYAFLRWGQGAFDNFKVVPPNTGICHQVNLEYLARVVEVRDGVAFPDTLVGTDSHTTMVNGLGVLGWGVGGIEAEAAMLGEALSMLVPQVVGFRLTGALREGATATDLVLTVTEILRKIGVVGKFVEYFGPGVGSLALADRATLGNMSPEYGATCGFFPVDDVTLEYLRLTGRDAERVALVEAYCKENMLWHEPDEHPEYSQVVELDLDDVEPSLAGPRRPQDRVPLASAKEAFIESLGTFGVDVHERHVRQGDRRLVPGERPADRRRRGRRHGAGARAHGDAREEAGPGRRRGLRARARLGRDRRDHVVHEHVEPVGHDRRRPAREEGGRARARAQAVGQVVARAGLEGRDRVLPRLRPRHVPRRARLQHRRLRLHDLHRQLRPAARERSAPPSPKATSSSAPSSPATATSRRASTAR